MNRERCYSTIRYDLRVYNIDLATQSFLIPIALQQRNMRCILIGFLSSRIAMFNFNTRALRNPEEAHIFPRIKLSCPSIILSVLEIHERDDTTSDL